MAAFRERFGVTPETRILDVGGREFNWSLLPFTPRVTILNLSLQETQSGRIEWVIGDGRKMPFADASFDIVYSNSVIEHLGTREDQQKFAAECRRVGRSYHIQTPNRNFPVEPHLLTPFFHWLPRSWQKRLLRNGTVWGWITRPDESAQHHYLDTTRMLDRREFAALFPDAVIREEKLLGLAKSFSAERWTDA